MSLPLKWASGDHALVRVKVTRIVTDAISPDGEALVSIANGPHRHTNAKVPVADLQFPPLVADDPRVSHLVAVARELLSWDWLHLLAADRRAEGVRVDGVGEK